MSQKPMIFAYSWHLDHKEEDYTCIRIYGIDEKNRNVCVRVNDFTPYVYLELPRKNENVRYWNNARVLSLINKIRDMMGKCKPIKHELQFKRRLYYSSYHNGGHTLFPYLKLYFNTANHIRTLGYKLSRPTYVTGFGQVKLKIHEQQADPILQLTSNADIPAAGWIRLKNYKQANPANHQTTCDAEFSCKWTNLERVDTDDVPSPLIMGWDIEVTSSVKNTGPKSERPGDKVFQISCVFARQGEPEESWERYILSLGENIDMKTLGKGVEAQLFDTEHDLLLGFQEIIQDKNPNITVGYNIFGFDIPYMIARAKQLYCYHFFDQQCMRKERHSPEKSISWSSAAYRNQNFIFLDTEGRLNVDLYPVVKNNYKLDNYKLSTVSEHFLKGLTKDPLDMRGIFRCYAEGMMGGRKGAKALGVVGKYCVQDSVLVVKLFHVLTTWVALCEMSKVCNTPILSLYTRGQQLKVFSQVYKKCLYDNIVVEKDAYTPGPDDYYVGATVFPPNPGLYEKVVPFDFSSLYPTTIIAHNICWSTLVTDEKVPDRLCRTMIWHDHIGCSHDPKVIRKKELTEIITGREQQMTLLRRERDLTRLMNKKTKELKLAKLDLTPNDNIIKELREELKQLRKIERDKAKYRSDWKKTDYQDKINEIKKQTKPFREERSELQKSKPKHIICAKRKFRWLKKPMGVLPEILTHLLDTRKATKKQMKHEKGLLKELQPGTPEYKKKKTFVDVLNQRQLALKVSANSGYGITGARKGYLPFMPVAMATTYGGRRAIHQAAEAIQNEHKGKLVYGDSVSEDTPVLIKIGNKTVYRTIDNICNNPYWKKYHGTKQMYEPKNVYVWSDNGFTKINKVIRHKTSKKLYRVLTHTGCVTVTEDHSLLDPEGKELTIKDVGIGTELCIRTLPNIEQNDSKITHDEAFSMGLFYADGSCGYYNCSSGNKASWAINNLDKKLLEKTKKMLENTYNFDFVILDTLESSGVYKLVPKGKGITKFVKRYRNKMYDKRKYKKVPDIIFGASKDIKKSFLEGYYAGDGDKDKNGYIRFDNKGQIGSAGLYYLYHCLGYKASINTRGDKKYIYRITCTKNKQRKCPNKIKKIEFVGITDSYVYDLETENHHFSAGIGQLVVHNTDSNYVSFPHLSTAQEIWDYSEKVAAEVTKLYPPPMNLAFEEVIYWKFFILTKKRYMSLACERDGIIDKKIKKKGVLLSRRDNCEFIRQIYAGVIMKIFYGESNDAIMYHVIEELNKLFGRCYQPDMFVITKAVGDIGDLKPVMSEDDDGKICHRVGDYKVPLLPDDVAGRTEKMKKKEATTEREYYLKCLPAQVQLAQRMRERGEFVAPGTRLEYLITVNKGHTAKQYYKVEDVGYFKKHSRSLKLDYMYYLKQLTNPLDQVLNILHRKNPDQIPKNFTLSQYHYRYKIREKMLTELRNLFTPVVVFEE